MAVFYVVGGAVVIVVAVLLGALIAAIVSSLGAGIPVMTSVFTEVANVLGAVTAPFAGAMLLATFGDLRVASGRDRPAAADRGPGGRVGHEGRRQIRRVGGSAGWEWWCVWRGRAWRPRGRTDVARRARLTRWGACSRRSTPVFSRLNPDIDIGYDRVAARCPALVRRVSESGVSAWLPRDWQRPGNDLSAGGLRELRQLLARELTTAGGGGRESCAGVERVHDVLASLARSDGERSWLVGADEGVAPQCV